jgi:hypothetical protein
MEIVEVNQSPVYLVTFGSGKTWYPAVQRLKHQAIRSKRFGKIVLYDEKDLNFNLTENDFDFYQSNPRGYGMWIWKPLIIRDMLNMYPECEIVLYLDSGCEINSSPAALEKFDSYIATVRQNGGIAFELPFIEENWTSDFVIEDMEARDLALTRQLAGGIFFIKNSISYHTFLDSWITWMKRDNFKYLTGSKFNSSSNHTFHEHRFDQSIFSILWKKNGFTILPDESFWASDWKLNGKDYPIWSTRNRLRFSYASNRFFLLIYRGLRIFLLTATRGKIII